MGDFQQFEQDFYPSGYYVDAQGHAVSYYQPYDSNLGSQEVVPDPFLEPQPSGEVYPPTETSGSDPAEDEPPLLVGNVAASFC